MKILGIIPARGGSKGIPRKNIKPLAGKPLIAHTIIAAQKSKFIDKVVLSTEDSEIAQVAESFGAEIINRPLELAQDETKTAPVLIHAVKELEIQGYSPDVIVLLQPTCPLRDEIIIDGVVKQLLNSDNDSVFTVFWHSQAMPYWQKFDDGTVKSLYDYHLRPRRQDVEQRGNIYCENGAVYAIKREAFEKHNDFIGENPAIYPVEWQVDIDTQEDFEIAEKILLNKK
ncbi:MAG: acylneuraminate cytidylyltransferase family protein [bacterium]